MKHQGKIEDISVHKIDNVQTREGKDARPDPEVLEKKPRRHFTAAYKLRILKEYDACAPGRGKKVLFSAERAYTIPTYVPGAGSVKWENCKACHPGNVDGNP